MSDDIRTWLSKLGLDQYVQVFEDNNIAPDILEDLTDQDLKELGVALGDRKRILRAADMHRTQAVEYAEAERRQLTVMFCDLVGSTDLSVRVDPEELRHIISSFQNCCESVVEKYGGRVARYMGDGLLVYFGYPVADEHDPERAIRTGLEIIYSVNELRVEAETVLRTRIGIATGDVIVGDLIGEGVAQEHAVVGETPNLAARLQGLAVPDSLVISHATKRLVGGLFQYSDLGLHTLKGFSKKVPAWRVDQEADVDSRFDAIHEGGELKPLLGREMEIATLLTCWMRARKGDGQTAVVTGDAGIGKSHVVSVLRTSVARESHILHRYFCVPHHQKSALFPVVVQLGRLCGIKRADTAPMKLRKIEQMIREFSDQPEHLIPLYASFMGVPVDDSYAPLNLSPRLLKERLLDALVAQLASFAYERPMLLIFEDLHWIDPTTMELLGLVMQKLAHLPVFLVLTARSEFVIPWPQSASLVALNIERLNHTDVTKLIDQVTNGKRLPVEVVSKILEKTDGVPLFVEELTKYMLETDLLEEQGDEYVLKGNLPAHAVPSTLHDSLMARLDRLGAGKKVAQIGASIGRTFSHELLAKVSEFEPDKLGNALEKLKRAELIYPVGQLSTSYYLFKHALIQDAAYSTLLKENRRKLHNRIARTLEKDYPGTTEQQPQILAHHYTQAGKVARGIMYYERAARKSINRAAHEEAQKQLSLALELLTQVRDDNDRLQLELGLQVAKGLVLESTVGYGAMEVEKTYDRARELCERLDNKAELVPVLLGLYVFNLVRGEHVTAHSIAVRCVTLSKQFKRQDFLIESYAALGYVEGHLGDFKASIVTLKLCISLYQAHTTTHKFANITAQDPCVSAMSFLAIILWLVGEVEESQTVLNNALAHSDQLDCPINYAMALAHAAEYYHMRGEYELGLEHANKGVEVSASHGYDSWYLVSLVHAGLCQGTLSADSEGIAMAQQGMGLMKTAGAGINMSYFGSRKAWCLHLAGRHDEAQALMETAFADCHQSHDRLHSCMLHQIQGDILLSGPSANQEAALEHFVLSRAIAQEQGAVIGELRATARIQSLRMQMNLPDETTAHLAKLIEKFPVTCVVPDLVEARRILADTYKNNKLGIV